MPDERGHRSGHGTEDRALAAARDRPGPGRPGRRGPFGRTGEAVTEAVRSGTPLNQSNERAARMLGLFTPERAELTLAGMAAAMDTSKAATHRYALALRHAGLLRYDTARQVYTLGPRIVELAASALAGLRIIKVAGPNMERLVARVNESVVLSVWDGESPVVVRVEDNTDRVVR